jgi:hypothetical protein
METVENIINRKEILAARSRKWYAANREKAKAQSASCYKKHKDERTVYNKKYYENNKQELAAKNKEYYYANSEASSVRAKAWYAAHREQELEKKKEYYKVNKERIVEYRKGYYIANRGKFILLAKEYRETYPEKIKTSLAAYYETHKEKLSTYKKIWSAANKEHIANRGKLYRIANPEKMKKISHEKRARKANATVENFPVSEIYERDNWTCQLCKKWVNKRLKYPDPLSKSLDHIVPISRGGAHSRTNVHLTHLMCNMKAHTGGIKQTLLF